MGASGFRKRHKDHAKILAEASRCIYCAAPALGSDITIEHMPPRGMFRAKDRPKGLEFASCKSCNEGTKAADAAVAFLARIDQWGDDLSSWKVQESVKYLKSADDGAPGFIAEILGDDRVKDAYLRTPGGVLVEVTETHAGPIAQALLNVFAAKLGMAMYHEHVGEPLPIAGGVHGMWFLNSGMGAQTAEAMLRILPGQDTLKMGERKSASGQFDYRFNSDDKSIVAALTHFHSNIHFFTIAMAEPATYHFPRPMPFSTFVRPGELLKFMPKAPSAILMPPAGANRFPNLILPKSARPIHSTVSRLSAILK